MLEAEGRREAAFRDAEARERSAEAEAKATQVVSDAIASGSVQAINYFVANNYIKALESLAKSPNQKMLMLPVEAASVIGAIGGIAEIARETFGGEKPATRPTSGSRGRPPSTDTLSDTRGAFQWFCSISSSRYGPWAWFVTGLVLLALELVVPGGYFLWLGAAGLVTGLAAFIPADRLAVAGHDLRRAGARHRRRLDAGYARRRGRRATGRFSTGAPSASSGTRR